MMRHAAILKLNLIQIKTFLLGNLLIAESKIIKEVVLWLDGYVFFAEKKKKFNITRIFMMFAGFA